MSNNKDNNEQYNAENENTENSFSFDDEEDDFSQPQDQTLKPDSPSDFVKEHNNAAEKDIEQIKRNRSEKRHAVWNKVRIPLFTVIGVIVFAASALLVYANSTIDPEKVMNNVYIENLDVSGLTYEDTLASIKASYLFENSEIILKTPERQYTIKSVDVGMEALPEETAQKAFEYCKSGNFITNSFNAASLLFKKHVILPAPQVDIERLDEKINEFGNIVLGELKQHYVEYGDDGMLTLNHGKAGYNGDPSKVREQILEAFKTDNFNTIYVDYSECIAQPYEMDMNAFDALVYEDPVDARYDIQGNTVNIIPASTGRYLNKEEAAPFLEQFAKSNESVKIPFYISQPEITSQQLNDKLFSGTLGSFSTSYGSSTANRCANVARAASLINGTVIAPGEVFSFNKTVGHRTKENGFYTAKEYVDGQSVDGIGGGTCQVSSTLYSAVLYADMSIVERLNHMMSVGYIPLGQDATVSDSGVDFKFKNSSDYPVKIAANANGSTITISIVGTPWEPKREVKLSHSTTTSGENTVVYSTRSVYSNGQLISTDRLNSSTYMPHKPANP